MTSAGKLTLEAYHEQHSVFWHLLPLFGWEHTGVTDPHTPPISEALGFSKSSQLSLSYALFLHREVSAFLEGLLRSTLHSCKSEAPGHFCLTIVSG